MPNTEKDFPELVWVVSGDGQIMHACILSWSPDQIYIDNVDNPGRGLVHYWTTQEYIHTTREAALKAAVKYLEKVIANQQQQIAADKLRLCDLESRLASHKKELEKEDAGT